MTPMQTLAETLGDIAILSSAPALILFVLYYGIRSPWRLHPAGRALMYMTAAMSSVMLFSLSSVFFGREWDGRDWVRLVLFAGVSLTAWWLFYTLIKAQNGPEHSLLNRPNDRERVSDYEALPESHRGSGSRNPDNRGAGDPEQLLRRELDT